MARSRHDDRGSRSDDEKGEDRMNPKKENGERRRREHRKKESRREKERSSRSKSRDDEHRRSKDRGHRKRDDERERKHKREERSKRHREDDERKHSRDRKRHKKEDRKSRKKSDDKKHDRRDSENDQTPKIAPSTIHLGDIRGIPPAGLLDPVEDYFSYHQHFWLYLYREEKVAFNELTSEEAREAFGRFVKRYNTGDLEVAYYEGLPPEALEEAKTTRHSWSFKTSESELASLRRLQEGVRKQTEYKDPSERTTEPHGGSTRGDVVKNVMSAGPGDEDNEARLQRRLTEKRANRRLREHVRTAEEEFSGGRKEGRERQMEKRKEVGARTHGAAKDREETSMGGVEISDNAIYGDDAGGFQAALVRERNRARQREENRTARIAELQKKEDDKQEAMLKMLGLSGIKPGQKITIAPRKDG